MMVRRFIAVERVKSPIGALIDVGAVQKSVERQLERGERSRSLYASDYGQCQRKVWFQFFPEVYVAEETDARTLRIFHNGDAVHERLGDYIKRSGVVFLEEQDVPRDALQVHGRCDGMAIVHGRFCVVEFKSINAVSVADAKPEHQGQVMWYMHMWEELRVSLRAEAGIIEGLSLDIEAVEALSLGRELSVIEKMLLCSVGPVCGEVVYESKQTQEIFSFIYELNEELIGKVRRWFEQVAGDVARKHMPEVRYSRGSYPCRWSSGACPFYDVCWK